MNEEELRWMLPMELMMLLSKHGTVNDGMKLWEYQLLQDKKCATIATL